VTAPAQERVVLLDESGHAVGTAAKAEVHHRETPLHLAFSCYVLDDAGRLLVTRRALHKATFPGVWTNSFCGHPAPGEDVVSAVRRRGSQELGLVLEDLDLVLPRFRYEATMPDGVRENELCPVFVARTGVEPVPDPDEVADHEWVPWAEFRDAVTSGAREVSVWCGLQVPELAAAQLPDGGFAAAPYGELPPAAR
jgi:isopentenyl-diphosphate Delta-isomerase